MSGWDVIEWKDRCVAGGMKREWSELPERAAELAGLPTR